MIYFEEYLLNEMPKALKDASVAGDKYSFEEELRKVYLKTKNSLLNPGKAAYNFQGAKNIVIHDSDNTRKWPYMTFDVEKEDGSTSKVILTVPNEEDVSKITDFQFIIDGQEKKFKTTTSRMDKRTGDIEAGASYVLSGLKQAIFGGKIEKSKTDKIQKAIQDLSDDEILEILKKRHLSKNQ